MEASRENPGRWILLAIIFMGFILRTYQLGEDSFWNDEAGQGLAAIQPSFKSLLDMSRNHAMAMPLDYLVSFFTNKLDVNEYTMRFPSVIWSTLYLGLPGFNRPDIIAYIKPMPLIDLMDNATHDNTPQFLIARSILEENETAQIVRAGFDILYDAGTQGRQVSLVYIRE
jgi:hypothetical protein